MADDMTVARDGGYQKGVMQRSVPLVGHARAGDLALRLVALRDGKFRGVHVSVVQPVQPSHWRLEGQLPCWHVIVACMQDRWGVRPSIAASKMTLLKITVTTKLAYLLDSEHELIADQRVDESARRGSPDPWS